MRKQGWRLGSEGRRCDPTVASTTPPPRPSPSCRIHHLAVASTISATLDLAVASLSLLLLSLCHFYLCVASCDAVAPCLVIYLGFQLAIAIYPLAVGVAPRYHEIVMMIPPAISCSARPILSTVISSQAVACSSFRYGLKLKTGSTKSTPHCAIPRLAAFSSSNGL
jgi:hypothetical protein